MRRTAGVALAGVLALTLAGCGGHDRPSTPGAVARQWADARLHKDQDTMRSLQCAGNDTSAFDQTMLVVPALSGFRVTRVVKSGSTWTVILRTVPAANAQSFDLTVVRSQDGPIVCDGASGSTGSGET